MKLTKQIVLLDGSYANPGDLSWGPVEELGEMIYYDDTDHEDVEEIVNRIAKAEVVVTNKVKLTSDILERLPNLELIVVSATGVNNIDVGAASQAGVKVANVPSYSTASVAQHTIALILEMTNKVGSHHERVQAGEWSQKGQWTFFDTPLVELSGKKMGIIGFGEIGQKVGQIAKAFGMEVLAYNRSQSEQGREIATYVELDYLLQHADIISLHLPLTDQTQQLIDEKALNQMKDDAILVNTARGPLVDEHAVAQALSDKRLYAFIADVATTEPIPSTHPLLKARNAIITPHMAWSTQESRGRLIAGIAENIKAYLEGYPKNIVN